MRRMHGPAGPHPPARARRVTHITYRRDARHRAVGDEQHARMLSPDTCLRETRAHDSPIEQRPSGQKGDGDMAEITPKAPGKADTSATKTAAARVSKKTARQEEAWPRRRSPSKHASQRTKTPRKGPDAPGPSTFHIPLALELAVDSPSCATASRRLWRDAERRATGRRSPAAMVATPLLLRRHTPRPSRRLAASRARPVQLPQGHLPLPPGRSPPTSNSTSVLQGVASRSGRSPSPATAASSTPRSTPPSSSASSACSPSRDRTAERPHARGLGASWVSQRPRTSSRFLAERAGRRPGPHGAPSRGRLQAHEAFVDDLLFLDLKGRVAKRLLQLATPSARRASRRRRRGPPRRSRTPTSRASAAAAGRT